MLSARSLVRVYIHAAVQIAPPFIIPKHSRSPRAEFQAAGLGRFALEVRRLLYMSAA